jgi:hypothetical protein
MPCPPVPDNQVLPPAPSPFPGAGGFAISLPNLNIPFPNIPIEDLTGLFNSISFLLPPGLISPALIPNVLNDIPSAIQTLMQQVSPFLMLYKFLLPILNMVLCILEVICSLLNPFSLGSAINNLFRNCIPEFLSLFPIFALPLMIISLLLLILALIDYLITRIIGIIDIIIHNIEILSKAATRLDNDSIIEIVKKIGNLLCILQGLFVIFGVFALIIQIIKAMLSLSFDAPPCSDSNGTKSPCCDAENCPDFLRNNSDITYSTGNFLYYNEVGRDSGLTLPVFFPAITAVIRPESWQFYDPTLSQRQAFINITHAYDLPSGSTKVFFPAGTNYTSTTSPSSVPYIISFRFFYTPTAFSFNPTDPKGSRYMRIKNAIIQNSPTAGVSSFNNSLTSPFNGTLHLIGGVITEDDGTPLFDSNGNTIPINTFIHKNPTVIPSIESEFFPNDGYLFSNVTYTFTINHEVLVGESLITLGCIPEVAQNRDFINATIGTQFSTAGVNLGAVSALLPDVSTGPNGTQTCVANAILKYRQSISIDSTNQFQSDILNCLNTLKSQTNTAMSATISAGFDQYKSNFTLDTNIQFTTQPIHVLVSLNENSGQSMTLNLPVGVAGTIATQLAGNVSLGEIGNFVYDGYQFFIAPINSNLPGNGTVKVEFNNTFISTLENPSDTTQTPSVTIKQLEYTFVQSPAPSGFGSSQTSGGGSGIGGIGGSGGGGGDGDFGAPRRDEGDVSRDNNSGGSDL